MAALNPAAMQTYRQGLRMGANPSLGVLAQMGRFRSLGTAPNVVAGGMQNQQAAFANQGLPNPIMALLAMQLRGGQTYGR
jgi:hypothetical protein